MKAYIKQIFKMLRIPNLCWFVLFLASMAAELLAFSLFFTKLQNVKHIQGLCCHLAVENGSYFILIVFWIYFCLLWSVSDFGPNETNVQNSKNFAG